MKSPKLDERVVEPLSDDELRAMLKACVPPKGATPAEALRHRRDEAMIRLMLESGGVRARWSPCSPMTSTWPDCGFSYPDDPWHPELT